MNRFTLGVLALAIALVALVPTARGGERDVFVFMALPSAVFDAKAGLITGGQERLTFDLAERYLHHGTSTYELESCRLDMLMMCVIIQPLGLELHLPRFQAQRTTWVHGNRRYMFVEGEAHPFGTGDTQGSTVYVFHTDLCPGDAAAQDICSPSEAYFLDSQLRLRGFVGYLQMNPERSGLDTNLITTLYWADGEPLPLDRF